MAKIYETEQDVKRDDVARHRSLGTAIAGAGLSTLLFSAFTAAFSFLGHRFIPENAKNLFGGSMRKGMKDVGWFATGMTVASGASAVAGTIIKKHAQTELDKLGPEEIVSVNEAQNYMASKTEHVKRLLTENPVSQMPPSRLP